MGPANYIGHVAAGTASHREELHVKRRRGFTLVETVLVLVVVSLCGMIALPKFTQAVRTSNLNSAKNKLTTLYGSARSTAASSGRTAYLHLNNNKLYATAVAGGVIDTVTPVENLYAQYGISVSANKDSIRIDPAGMGRDSVTITLIKGGQSSTVRISQFGRILK